MPKTTAKGVRKPNTRRVKNKKVMENKDAELTEPLKTKLSEQKMPKKRQRKAKNKNNNVSKESARDSLASDNIIDVDYIQDNNIHLTSKEAIQQPTSNDKINNKPENKQIQSQHQKQTTAHVDNVNNIPLSNLNQQMYYFLDLPYVNEHEIGPPIDPFIDSSNESLKHNRSLHLNNTSYKNDSLFSAKTYLIANPHCIPYSANPHCVPYSANPLCVPCSANPLRVPFSANYIPNYHDQHNTTSNSQNNNEDLNLQSQQTQVHHSSVNHSKNTNIQQNEKELIFSNQAALVEWLRTRQDLDAMTDLTVEQCKILFLRTRNPISKVRDILVERVTSPLEPSPKELIELKRKARETFYNYHIKNFVGDIVWKQKLNRFLDATNYSEFKKSISFKSLKIFVIESLKIHAAYLIAIRNQEQPSYQEEVLDKIKSLDRLTTNIFIPSASGYNYVNELDLNMKPDNDDD
ncbi:17280_t:CDS:2 [Cetraspora pellucida]|uniref:17280_t:CDS:1 n=1 Tax=Cetraspora pellucida TaxID=1433469 RepID=A0A9N9CP85_9GLOM|nr:17280_t:CDS:2 [Cetraspora pellucida]